jgi:hypothetical protein
MDVFIIIIDKGQNVFKIHIQIQTERERESEKERENVLN